MKLSGFKVARPIIGMIHVAALPGTPGNSEPLNKIVGRAVHEAGLYRAAGVDGIALENMHDVPYLRGGVGPEITASMSIVAQAVKQAFGGVTGIQILAAANCEAVAVAQAAGLDWVRVEGFAFAHVADEGWIDSCAAKLLRYRKQIGADKIAIWADIKKKHSSHAVTADISLEETAHAAEFLRADAVIVTGPVTGRAPEPADISAAQGSCHIPVVLGSGMDLKNIAQFLPAADGFIVGSSFKKKGDWRNGVEASRVEQFMEIVRARRGS